MIRTTLIILLLIIFSCGPASKSSPSSPSDVVMTYLEALKRNDERTALSCWTIKGAPVPVFKKDLAEKALKLGMVIEQRSAKNSEYKILDETKENDVAFVTVERTFLPQNTITQIKVRMLLDDDAWKIAQWGIR